MKRIALLVIGAVVALSGCSSAASTGAAPTTALNPAVRGKSCQDYLPVLSKLKEVSAESANKTAEDSISMLQQSAQWPTLSEVDRQSTIAGIRDAATGKC
ncbi:lipoprotein [Nocardia sp. NBC_01499]|uniref:lipoprotein n=1 Tax=Nocardia sp. NBC_01499 TaxID=2903597 RepID=UPI00386EC81A